MGDSTLKVIEASLSKLDSTLEDILREVATLEESEELYNKYLKISNKAYKLKSKTLKLAKKTIKKNKRKEDNPVRNKLAKAKKTVEQVEQVEFKNIPIDFEITHTVGHLPVSALFEIPKVCSAILEITNKKTVILKKGSIICKSNTKNIESIKSKELINQRTKAIETKDLQEGDYFNQTKLLVTNDIVIKGVEAAKVFILGRNLRNYDSKYSIMVGETKLEDYLRIGNNS